jgi:hypothetical protein
VYTRESTAVVQVRAYDFLPRVGSRAFFTSAFTVRRHQYAASPQTKNLSRNLRISSRLQHAPSATRKCFTASNSAFVMQSHDSAQVSSRPEVIVAVKVNHVPATPEASTHSPSPSIRLPHSSALKISTSLPPTWQPTPRSWIAPCAISRFCQAMNISFNFTLSSYIPQTVPSEPKMTTNRSRSLCRGLPQSASTGETRLPLTTKKVQSCVLSPTAAKSFLSQTSTSILITTPQRLYHSTRRPENIILIIHPPQCSLLLLITTRKRVFPKALIRKTTSRPIYQRRLGGTTDIAAGPRSTARGATRPAAKRPHCPEVFSASTRSPRMTNR